MNFIADDFYLHYLASYTLYIQSDFQYDHIVVTDEDKKVLVYMNYQNSNPSSEAMKVLSMPFQNVFICLPHQNLIWVPGEVFDEKELDLYADYFIEANLNPIKSKNIASLGVVALYQYDLLMYNRWYSLFPEASFIPNFDVLMCQALSRIPAQGEVLGVHVYDDQIDLFLFVNGEFKLYNTFEVATADDLSYFVLSVFKNFAIRGKIEKVLLSGTNEESEWFERLGRYTDCIEVILSAEKWVVSNPAVEKLVAQLNVLMDSELCV